MKGDELIVATLQHKLAIATARSEWGSKRQRTEEAANAERFRARLAEYGR